MRRQAFFWIGLAAVLLIVGVLGGRSRNDGPPLDPDSTGPLGTRALTELVEAFGSDVRRGLPDAETSTVLVLTDRLGDFDRRELRAWVEAGGTLVVADPGSPLSPGLADLSSSDELAAGDCSIAALDGLTLAGPSFGRYRADAGSEWCFRQGDLAFAVSQVRGSGRIISVGGAVVFTNEHLDEGDNAVLAVELLATDGGRLAVVFEPGATVGNRDLADLVPTRVRWFGAQLLLAFAVYVLWRLRRFGRVVIEPQLVEMPGSLLVRARGELSRRSGGHEAAARQLSSDLERRLRKHHRIPPDHGVDQLVEATVDRSGIDRETVVRALGGSSGAPVDREQLVSLLVDIDAVQAVCLAEPGTEPHPTSDPVPEGAHHV